MKIFEKESKFDILKRGLKIVSKNNILRCEGRIKNVPITPIAKLPILINRNHYLAKLTQCVKSARIQSYSGPHFSRIFLHSDWISPNTGKMLTRITPNTDTFYALIVWDVHLKLAHAGCKQVLTENRKNFGLPIQGSTFVI